MARPEQTEEQKVEELAKILHSGASFGALKEGSRELVPWEQASEASRQEARAQASYLRDRWEIVSNLLV